MNYKSQPPDMDGHKTSSPPLTRLTLRIGVTGHRPNNLQFVDEEVLQREIKRVLEFLRETAAKLQLKAGPLHPKDPPVLRIISPLAEGADRMLVKVANTLGEQFDLQCVLPFSQEEYETDFKTQDSIDEFHLLLSKATSVLELDGSRETADCSDRAYEALGKTVLDHSDVMIAIWNGESGRRGGTSQVVGYAELLNIPLVWIHSKAPHVTTVKVGDGWVPWETGASKLSEQLSILFLPPESSDDSEKRRPDLLTGYFKEKNRKLRFGCLWKLFRNLFASKVPTTRSLDFPTILPQEVSQQIDSALINHYLWADRLADFYANVYRSAFVFNYLMSAFAVLFAFLAFLVAPDNHLAEGNHTGAQYLFTFAEVITLVAIMLVTSIGTRRHWHERWIDYRLLAEHLRQTQFLMALGRAPASVFRAPTNSSNCDPHHNWMYWHLQAIFRHSGMIRLKLDRNYLQTVRSFLNESIRGQINYHERNAKVIESLNHRMHIIGMGLFFLAFVSALLHFVIHEPPWPTVLTTLTIVGPSFGAALAAIRSQGEFDRLMKSSRAMSSQLESFSGRLTGVSLDNEDLSSVRLSELAVEGTQLMVKDVLSWRLVVEEKPLDLPS